MATKTLFESCNCGRCGGSGSYSYCSMYGSRCFGCGGKGVKLTKRGAAAQRFLDGLRLRRASEIIVGQIILEDSYYSKPKWARVVSIETAAGMQSSSMVNGVMVPNPVQPAIVINSEGLSSHLGANSLVRIGLTAEQKAEYKALALRYQATLGKTGVCLKSAAEENAACWAEYTRITNRTINDERF